MVVYDKKYPVKTLLKKRRLLYPKYPRLRFGDTGIVFKQSIRFEFIYFFFIRKFIKKLLKKQKRFIKIQRVWVFIRPNHVLTKKGKNSRMGKGKGSFIRWCSLIEKGFIFAEFTGISSIRLQKYALKLEKKFKIPLQIINNPNNFTKLARKQHLGSNNMALTTPENYHLFFSQK